MKRRVFLKNTGLSTGSLLATSSFSAFFASCRKTNMNMEMSEGSGTVTVGNFSRELPVPKTVGNTTSLTAQVTHANLNGSNISVLGYHSNGILGPTFRVISGSDVNIRFLNNLDEKSNIHWHGLKIAANMDGHPESVVNTGDNFNFSFNVNQRAALNWYHPHPDRATAKQAFMGLAGLFIVNDTEETALNLPSGIYEMPLVIQDKRLNSAGIIYNPTIMERMTGYLGEMIIVNGVAFPYTEVSTRYYRLRILNGSNARIYNLSLSNGNDMVIIGNDGGLLKNPATVKTILLAPGERIDVLVNFAGLAIGTEVYLESLRFAGAGNTQGKQDFKILKFKVTNNETHSFIPPTTLSLIETLAATSATKTRKFILSGMQMSGTMSMSGLHRINNKVFDGNRIDETVAYNTTEIWTFDNSNSDEPHPIHLHGVHFQLLERLGGRGLIIPSESGWKDTVLLLPGEVVKIIIPFANLKGVYVFHCHNLEHEDNGMMLQYELK